MAIALRSVNYYTEITCYRCAVVFAVPDDLYQRRLGDHESFWCPHGHEQHFTGQTSQQRRIAELETELQRTTLESDRRKRNMEWAQTRARGANIKAGKAKAQLRRTIERVHAGVCPHCHRTFKQLAAHMQSKHAEAVNG